MSEIANKTILELTPLTEYLESDAIPVLRPYLHEDNCIALGNIIWYDKNTKRLIINGRYRFDMSNLLQANISIKLTGDGGITDFTYNNEPYNKGDSIESEDSFNATITANVDSHYTFNEWQFDNTSVYNSNPILYRFTESGELKATTTPKQYTITVNTNNSSYGTVSDSGNYNYGTSCIITATPNEGYRFVEWTKNGSQVSTNSNYTFTVTENATYTAVFAEKGDYDYYVGQYSNKSSFESATDLDIISNAEGKWLTTTPIYPSSNGYSMFTGNNKLMYVLINQSMNINLIKVDTENPGSIDPINLDFTGDNGVFTDTLDTITIGDTIYKIYRKYNSNYTTENGFRIKFNQTQTL